MIIPYINFNGKCEGAMAFYETVFGSEVISKQFYGDYIPDGLDSPPEGLSNWVLHASMKICGSMVYFSDETQPVSNGNMLSLTLSVPTAKDGQGYFERLKADGNITLPPTETFYSMFHAGIIDKFGIGWNIIAEEAPVGDAK
jgi:PhnB protein